MDNEPNHQIPTPQEVQNQIEQKNKLKNKIEKEINRADQFFKKDIPINQSTEKTGNPKDLFSKHNQKLNKDVETIVDPTKLLQKSLNDNSKSDNNTQTIDGNIDDTTKQTKKPFIKSLKETNSQLEKEASELRQKLEDYEKNKLPYYENTINELKSKIDDGGTVKQINELKDQLNAAIEEKQKRENDLSEELTRIKNENTLLHLPSDPEFKKQYDEPISRGYHNISKLIGVSSDNAVDFNKAIQAYEASLNCPSEIEKERQNNIAMELLNDIYTTLQPIQQAKFNQLSYDVLNNIENRNEALKEWQSTKARIDQERDKRLRQVKSKTSQHWDDAFKRTREKINSDIKYSDDIAKIIQNEKYDDDTSEDEDIAYSALQDNSKYTPDDVMRVMNQGVNYKKLKAYSSALEKQLAESNETIKRLRGSSTSNGTIGSSSSGTDKTPPHQKQSSGFKSPSELFRSFNQKYNR